MTKDLLQSFAAQALPPLLALAAAGFTWACTRAARWLSAKTKNEAVKGVIDRLNDAVNAGVMEVEQSTVKAVKAQTVDGKLSVDAAKVVKQVAIDSVKAHLGPDAIAEAQKVLGVADIEAVIGSRVEAAVSAMASAAK